MERTTPAWPPASWVEGKQRVRVANRVRNFYEPQQHAGRAGTVVRISRSAALGVTVHVKLDRRQRERVDKIVPFWESGDLVEIVEPAAAAPAGVESPHADHTNQHPGPAAQ